MKRIKTKTPEIIKSVFTDEQDLLAAIINLHIKDKTFDVDPMYCRGNFYKEIPQPKYRFDINPVVNGVKKEDARNLPISSKSIDSIILDPPFMFGIHSKTQNYSASKIFGIFLNFNELKKLYIGIIKEAHRILRVGGILVFKCQDFTDSKSTMTHCFVWQWATEQGFCAKDLAILNLPRGKIANPNLKQRHLRKVHTYFWVFKRGRVGINPKYKHGLN